MAKIEPTSELIRGILQRIPEGFIKRQQLSQRLGLQRQVNKAISECLQAGGIGEHGEYLYDPARISAEVLTDIGDWCKPALPAISREGELTEPTISEKQQERQHRLGDAEADQSALIAFMDATPGYVDRSRLQQNGFSSKVIQQIISAGHLQQKNNLIYDPLRISQRSIITIHAYDQLDQIRRRLISYLSKQPGSTAPQDDLEKRFGKETLDDILKMGGFSRFEVPLRIPPHRATWIQIESASSKQAQKVARDAVEIKDGAWEEALLMCGDTLRPGTRDGKNRRTRVIARSYTIGSAAHRLQMRPDTLETAAQQQILISFTDPEQNQRLTAQSVEDAVNDAKTREIIASFEQIRLADVALVAGEPTIATRSKLKSAGINHRSLTWGDVRGRWGLPDTLSEYKSTLTAVREARRAEREAEKTRMREQERQERQRRRELRERLVASFPSWQHDWRVDQQIHLHVGPPNSGKTHDALTTLAESGSGWYLAPLRLLAFEIFDRLNQRGVPCNLLTGEEYIPVPGASITAATIEMFNPNKSGECVIIDEAQMLADSDRGWAWTRALMEAQAPLIHVIAPDTARHLITQMAQAAAIPLTVTEHERLAPIQVADERWPLGEMPGSTILVAFSRRMVLHLKNELEKYGRRVSVVYGSLPPEVRRRQADRFASGETEICVATDAVGMGLNLPAEHVCFYEVQKFDGERIRDLSSAEVQQIGGRAGRFGLATAGVIGATTRRNLNFIREAYYEESPELTQARVAPTVQDLEMIPGSLASKLEEWAELKSIPETLRNAINTADLSERVELARMLSDGEVDYLGLATAMRLINAPTRKSSRLYWRDCATAILAGVPMPLPPNPAATIADGGDLEHIETCVTCADIYLWLSRREEFERFAPAADDVRDNRQDWSQMIDQALLKNLDTSQHCQRCGAPMPPRSRRALCNNCLRHTRDRRR